MPSGNMHRLKAKVKRSLRGGACDLPEVLAVIDDLIYALLGRTAAHVALQVAVHSSACLQVYLHHQCLNRDTLHK